jgi:mannose-1-phosphate guanylyltransferase
MDQNNFCVIMAGGVGSRFWPVSRTQNPKQFIDILGVGRTLLQMTYDRFAKILPTENIYIVTNEIYTDVVLEQLPDISKEQVLGEPMRRNTAPCIAYANFKILKKNPNARIVVAPSDHLIMDEAEFLKVISEGLDFVKSDNILLTLGIEPSRPDTGYGYIQINKDIKVSSENKSLHKVKTFTEKPDLELAKVFVKSGEFFWNSGIFIWSLKSIFKAFETHLPEVNSLFTKGIDLLNTEKEYDFINETYESCNSISIDYGVMEKADNVFVYSADFGWSDLGTWGSLYEHSTKDENENAVKSDKFMSYDTKDCIIKSKNGKLMVVQGLEDYIVVDTDDVLLICKKQDEQQIRKFVNDVTLKYGEDFI